MTIVTKVSSEKKPNTLDDPLVQNLENEIQIDDGSDDSRYYMLHRRVRRMSAATTVCGFLTAILVVCVGIMGGIYLYRQFVRAHHVRAWCSIPYQRNGQRLVGGIIPEDAGHDPLMSLNSRLLEGPNGNTTIDKSTSVPSSSTMDAALNQAKSNSENKKSAPSFIQEFDIDLEFENYETIDVPDFRYGRRGRFVHDFAANKTAIVDITGGRCFLMALNRRYVAPPRTLYDLLNKMLSGAYDINTEVVRQTMTIQLPALEKADVPSPLIRRQCWNFPIYQLEKTRRRAIHKRSAAGVGGTPLQFGEFPGSHILAYQITNAHVLQDSQL